jgi:protein TonB
MRILLILAQASSVARSAGIPTAKTGRVFVEVDRACAIWVDGTRVGEAPGDATARMDLQPGPHVAKATSPDGAVQVERRFEVAAGEATLVMLRLAGAREDDQAACPIAIGQTPTPTSNPPSASPCRSPSAAGDLVAPKIRHRVEPEYPEAARSAGIGGKVVLRCIIDTEGRVQVDRVVKADAAILVEPSIVAASSWIYEPARLRGEPQAVYLVVNLNYGAADVPGEPRRKAKDRARGGGA